MLTFQLIRLSSKPDPPTHGVRCSAGSQALPLAPPGKGCRTRAAHNPRAVAGMLWFTCVLRGSVMQRPGTGWTKSSETILAEGGNGVLMATQLPGQVSVSALPYGDMSVCLEAPRRGLCAWCCLVQTLPRRLCFCEGKRNKRRSFMETAVKKSG